MNKLETKSLQTVTDQQVRDLTSEKIAGLNPLSKTLYSLQEKTAIEYELISFALCKNENYSVETKQAWISEFENMNINSFEAIKRIRLAKLEKKFGVTEFALFMNVDLSDYSTFYKHEQKEIPQPEFKVNYGYAIPFKHYRDFKKEKYPIIDEMNLYFSEWKRVEECIYLRDDTNNSSYYLKSDFEIKQ